jgi:hypothetical protein
VAVAVAEPFGNSQDAETELAVTVGKPVMVRFTLTILSQPFTLVSMSE